MASAGQCGREDEGSPSSAGKDPAAGQLSRSAGSSFQEVEGGTRSPLQILSMNHDCMLSPYQRGQSVLSLGERESAV